MLGQSCSDTSSSGRPETRAWTPAMRSRQGPRWRGRAPAAGPSCERDAAPVIAWSATSKAREKAASSSARAGRRPIQRCSCCAARRRGSPRLRARATRGLIGPACIQCAPRSIAWPRSCVVTARPPTRSRASRTATDRPRAINRRAEAIPAAPAPITITSGVAGTGDTRGATVGRKRACSGAGRMVSKRIREGSGPHVVR